MQPDPIPAQGEKNERKSQWMHWRLGKARGGLDKAALAALREGDFGAADTPGPALLGLRILTWKGNEATWAAAAKAVDGAAFPEGFVPDLWAEAWMRNSFIGGLGAYGPGKAAFGVALVRRFPDIMRWECERPEYLAGAGDIRGVAVKGNGEGWKNALHQLLRRGQARGDGTVDALLEKDPLRDIPDGMIVETFGSVVSAHPYLMRRIVPGGVLDAGVQIMHPYDGVRVPLAHLLARQHRHAELRALVEGGVKIDLDARDSHGQTLLHAVMQGIYFGNEAKQQNSQRWSTEGDFTRKRQNLIATIDLLLSMGGDIGAPSAPTEVPRISEKTGRPVRGSGWAKHGALPGETPLQLMENKRRDGVLPDDIHTELIAQIQRITIASRLDAGGNSARRRRLA